MFPCQVVGLANGTERGYYSESEANLAKSNENDYRIFDTIAVIADSPLFPEEQIVTGPPSEPHSMNSLKSPRIQWLDAIDDE